MQIPLNDPNAPFSSEQIAEQARLIWERAGRPDGRDLEHWFQAEYELRLQRAYCDQTQALLARGGGSRHGDV